MQLWVGCVKPSQYRSQEGANRSCRVEALYGEIVGLGVHLDQKVQYY